MSDGLDFARWISVVVTNPGLPTHALMQGADGERMERSQLDKLHFPDVYSAYQDKGHNEHVDERNNQVQNVLHLLARLRQQEAVFEV